MTSVLWIARTYPWADQPSFGVFYQTQARALARLGAQVTVGIPTPWAPWPLSAIRAHWRDYARAPRRAADGPISVIRPRYPNAPREPSWAMPDRMVAAAMWRARAEWRDPTIIHGHYSVTGLAAWRLSARARLPYVLTFHGSDMNVWPDEYPDRRADLRTAAKTAGAVFAVSRALVDRVREVTGVEAIHLPLGSDHAALAAAALPREEARARLGLPLDRTIALFLGNLKPSKGIRELALGILAVDRPLIGVFVGGGPEQGVAGDRPGAAERLVWRGPQPHHVAIQYLAAADVLVLPSFSEGLPTVLVEAGSLGVPVIASRVGGIPELLEPDRGTILPDITPGAIAAALTHVIDDRPAAEAAARRLATLVRRDYDVDTNAATLLDWYRRIGGS